MQFHTGGGHGPRDDEAGLGDGHVISCVPDAEAHHSVLRPMQHDPASDDGAGQMKEREVVFRLLGPADQYLEVYAGTVENSVQRLS